MIFGFNRELLKIDPASESVAAGPEELPPGLNESLRNQRLLPFLLLSFPSPHRRTSLSKYSNRLYPVQTSKTEAGVTLRLWKGTDLPTGTGLSVTPRR